MEWSPYNWPEQGAYSPNLDKASLSGLLGLLAFSGAWEVKSKDATDRVTVQRFFSREGLQYDHTQSYAWVPGGVSAHVGDIGVLVRLGNGKPCFLPIAFEAIASQSRSRSRGSRSRSMSMSRSRSMSMSRSASKSITRSVSISISLSKSMSMSRSRSYSRLACPPDAWCNANCNVNYTLVLSGPLQACDLGCSCANGTFVNRFVKAAGCNWTGGDTGACGGSGNCLMSGISCNWEDGWSFTQWCPGASLPIQNYYRGSYAIGRCPDFAGGVYTGSLGGTGTIYV